MACDTVVTIRNLTGSAIRLRVDPVTWPAGGMNPLQRHHDITSRLGPSDDQMAKQFIASLRSGVTTRIVSSGTVTYTTEGEVDYIRDICSDLESAGLTVLFQD